jgi:hypothetical protein
LTRDPDVHPYLCFNCRPFAARQAIPQR